MRRFLFIALTLVVNLIDGFSISKLALPSRFVREARSNQLLFAINKETPQDNSILNIELNDELKSSFMSYAMSTILGRALPDAVLYYNL
jgi:hypothetical protein